MSLTQAQFEATVRKEAAAHAEQLSQARRKAEMLQQVYEEQEASFIALITRVTNLRVAKGEYMAAKATGQIKEEKFNTGSAAVDRLLGIVQQKMQSATDAGGTLLTQLSDAAAESVTPFCPNAVNFRNDKAARTTGVAIITRSDLRSVRGWARRHLKDCPQCAQRAAAATPRWERYRHEDRQMGLAAAALSAGAPDKGGYRCALQIVRGKSLRQRVADDERRLNVFTATVRLHTTGSGGQPIADPQATADAMGTFAIKWADRSLAIVREKVTASAPWNRPETANPDMSAAIAMLLHFVVPSVRVAVVPRAELDAQYRAVHAQNPSKPPFAPPGSTAFDVTLAVSTPVQVAVLAPLIGLLGEQRQRRYFVDSLLTPLAARLGSAVGMANKVAHYVTVALNALDALHRLAETHGLAGAGKAAPPQQGVRRDTITAKLYAILLSLAVFGTRVEVEAAVPAVLSPQDAAVLPSAVARGKVGALRLAGAVLRNLRTLTPFAIPLANDPACADVAVRLTDAPTTFLEILNCTFSSNERLPSTSRNSALDLLITPKAKLSLGLKLYSELCVELYRPFDPAATAGAVLASQNGANGRPRAPPCVPVVDLPVDLAAANVVVSGYSERLAAALERLEAEAALSETQAERDGRVLLDQVTDALGQSAPFQQWKDDLRGMGLEVKLASRVTAEGLLPFGMSFVDPRESVEHLLYLRIEGSRTF